MILSSLCEWKPSSPVASLLQGGNQIKTSAGMQRSPLEHQVRSHLKPGISFLLSRTSAGCSCSNRGFVSVFTAVCFLWFPNQYQCVLMKALVNGSFIVTVTACSPCWSIHTHPGRVVLNSLYPRLFSLPQQCRVILSGLQMFILCDCWLCNSVDTHRARILTHHSDKFYQPWLTRLRQLNKIDK